MSFWIRSFLRWALIINLPALAAMTYFLSQFQGFLELALMTNAPPLAVMAYFFFKYRIINRSKKARQVRRDIHQVT